MARVDVFREKGNGKRKDRFHLVPIYPHQVADAAGWPKPPDRAAVAHTGEDEWTPVDGFEFLFSLFGNSLLQVVKPDGEVIQGYFRGLDRSTGNITVCSPENSQRLIRGIGSKTLLSFAKFAVDRLGSISEIGREIRTWHGVACT